MMVGNSATLTETMLTSTALGSRLNDAFEATAGIRPLSEASTRLRERQGLWALLGASAGLAFGTAPHLAGKLAEDPVGEGKDMLMRRLPVTNVFYLQLINKLMEQ